MTNIADYWQALFLFLQQLNELFGFSWLHSVTMLLPGELTIFYFINIRCDRSADLTGYVSISFDEFWSKGLKMADNVTDNHQLPIGRSTGAN